ncbi:MAG: DNA-3-methyladenine glycosylase 2 family protein [Chlorobiaceae bacterium]|nr:DNA-3-methyladenine glycosylase 2 family protein [Chlorobiaceae bacterium]
MGDFLYGLSPECIAVAITHLADSDPVMAQLVSECGHCTLSESEYRPFHTLTRAILGQQLSSQAAESIVRRLSKVVSVPFTPENFLAVPVDLLKASGLSAPKIRYILELAGRITTGRLTMDALVHLSDEEVLKTLMEVPGIGPWTAEMFLIFGLKRPDVLSLGDAGLQRSAKMLYRESYEGEKGPNLLARVSTGWRPYRSVASWYLWKYLDSR